MRRRFAKAMLLVTSLALGISGCAMPNGEQGSGFRMPGAPNVPRTPSANSSALPGTGSNPAVPGYSQALPGPGPNDPVPDAQSVAQVGFYQPLTGCATSGQSSCGCNACGTACPSPSYVMPPTAGWNLYGIDPQEFLCDGGDQDPRAIVRRDDSVGGLGLEDTVVHYTTEAGDIEIQASNRACLYAPRFLAVRKITGAVAGGRAIGLKQLDRPVGAIRVDSELPRLVMTDTIELAHADVARRIDALRERNRGVPIEQILQLEQASEVLEAMAGLSIAELLLLRDDEKAVLEKLALAACRWELDESLEVVIADQPAPTLTRDEHLEAFTIYEFPDAGRLRITKLADRTDALPGELVNFVIRVENVGDSPVNQVVLLDNLTTRLEYVEDTQDCSVDAEFAAVTNEGESLKLQWTLTEELKVGDSATIRFQCKVR